MAKGCDESGEESGLWAKWDLPEATLGVKLAEDLALSKFGEALVDREHWVDLSLRCFVEMYKVHTNVNSAIGFWYTLYS